MQKWYILPFALVFIGITAWISRPYYIHSDANPYHSRVFLSAYGGLPDTLNSLFTGSGKCAGCHATDPNFFASIVGQTYPATPLPDGHDVNPTDMWRSSIMANSAKDPFWRAKVAHEVAVNPSHQLELEDKCTSCHAPLGHFAAKYDGLEHYTMAMLTADSLALDGVSCVACHQQSIDSSGISFSGQLYFDTATIYGPYGIGKDDPPLYDLPMITYSGYTPMYGAHLVESTICADCHTLITETADLDGNLTGGEFVEQATYHEWVNSAYSGDGIDLPEGAEDLEGTCQSCHMPRIDDPVIISSGYAFLEPRTPYGLHQLVGANTAMIEIMRDNIETLGLTASEAHFDSTLLWTQQMLTQKSVDVEISNSSYHIIPDNDAYEVVVKLTNKAGHKFPSGYPSRRAFVEFIVHFDGDTIFHSGKLDPSGARILGSDDVGLDDYEPHYDQISNDNEVQIYEIVAADVNSNPTNVLERAAIAVKDNRLVPLGFSMNHIVYDTTTVEGNVLVDPNFNFENEITQGSGTDEITYILDLDLFYNAEYPSYDWDVTVNVWYQSMPPRWVESMFDYDESSINEFQELYESQGSTAVLVASLNGQWIGLIDGVPEELVSTEISISPNPAIDGFTTLKWQNLPQGAIYEVYNSAGARVEAGPLSEATGAQQIELPNAKGLYIVKVHYEGGVKALKVLVSEVR
jgi:hypothetical protein